MIDILNEPVTSLMRFGRVFRRFASECDGMAAIEMAFVFPFMVILYFGFVDVTNLLSAERRATLATSTLADLVTQAPATIKKADLTGFYNAVGPIMDPFPASSVKIDIIDFRKSGSNAVVQWSNTLNGSCGGTPATTGLTNLMSDGNDVVMARVCISYEPITGKVFGAGPFTLSDQMVLRPRQALTLDCTDC
jgi:Flp pilus assembly protein TadG